MNILAPSILAADFSRLGEQISAMKEGGAQCVHFDVMDGHYVPNVMLGTDDFNAIREVTNIPIDVHFMCTDPERFFTYFNWKENDRLSFHPETAKQPYRLLMAIREKGMKAGYAMSPGIPGLYLEEKTTWKSYSRLGAFTAHTSPAAIRRLAMFFGTSQSAATISTAVSPASGRLSPPGAMAGWRSPGTTNA